MNATNAFRLGIVVLLAGVLGAAIFIFNDSDDDTVDSGERRELRAYFTEINNIAFASDNEIRELQTEYSDANESVERAQEYFPKYVTATQSFIDLLQAVDPPGFVADEHAAYVSTVRAVQARNRNLLHQLEEATTVEEVTTIFERTAESRDQDNARLDACADLGDIARQYNIEAPSITGCRRPVIITATVEATAAP